MRGGKIETSSNRTGITRQSNYQGNRRMNFNNRMSNQGVNRPFKSNPKYSQTPFYQTKKLLLRNYFQIQAVYSACVI